MTSEGVSLMRIEFAYRVAVFANLLLLTGLYVDAWWHATFGRHSFWIPPHIVVYSGVTLLTAALALRWLQARHESHPLPAGYRVLALAIAVTVLAAPLDELWHRTFGEEGAFTLLALWSPPHLMALLSAIAGGLGLLSAMAREGGAHRAPWMMTILAACVIGFATFAIIPFEPTGIYRVGGIIGASIIAVILVGLRLLALALVRRPGTVTAIAAVVTPLVILLTLSPIPATVTTMPRMPAWTLLLAAFAAAGTLDLLARRRTEGLDDPKTLARWGMVYAAVFTTLFYPAANAAVHSGWSALEIAAIIAGSTVMGYAAGWAAWWAARSLFGDHRR